MLAKYDIAMLLALSLRNMAWCCGIYSKLLHCQTWQEQTLG